MGARVTFSNRGYSGTGDSGERGGDTFVEDAESSENDLRVY